MNEMPHCDPDDPNPCFACKCKYWRTERSGAPFTYTWGQERFHDGTNAERERIAFADHKKHLGYDPVRHPSAEARWV